jgi:serine kinase of HPr protein (carbohydrate metabolism regulator)
LALLAEAQACGMFARLIGDDRVSITPQSGRLVVRGHPAITGQVEERGTGILSVPSAEAAILRFVVDLESDPPRLPLVEAPKVEICGLQLPLLTMRAGLSPHEQARRVFAFIKRGR